MSTAAESSAAIADEFTASGFSAHDPAGNGSACLKLANARGALVDMSIASIGTRILEYRSCDGKHVDARRVAGIVLDILSPVSEHRDFIAAMNPAVMTLKGAVGVIAARHGLQVSLSVLGDDIEFFETYAEINVINLARPDRGTVRVNDDGALYWHYCLQSPETDGDGVMLAAAHDSRVGAA